MFITLENTKFVNDMIVVLLICIFFNIHWQVKFQTTSGVTQQLPNNPTPGAILHIFIRVAVQSEIV